MTWACTASLSNILTSTKTDAICTPTSRVSQSRCVVGTDGEVSLHSRDSDWEERICSNDGSKMFTSKRKVVVLSNEISPKEYYTCLYILYMSKFSYRENISPLNDPKMSEPVEELLSVLTMEDFLVDSIRRCLRLAILLFMLDRYLVWRRSLKN